MFRQNSSEAPFGPSNRWLPATASSLWEGFVPTFPRQRFSVTATIAPMRWLSRSLFRLANFSTPPTQQPRQNAAGAGWARARRAYGEAQRRDHRKQAAATTQRLGSGGESEARGASHRQSAGAPYAWSLGKGLPSRRLTSQPWRTNSAITDSAKNGKRSFTLGVSPSTKSAGSRFCTCMP